MTTISSMGFLIVDNIVLSSVVESQVQQRWIMTSLHISEASYFAFYWDHGASRRRFASRHQDEEDQMQRLQRYRIEKMQSALTLVSRSSRQYWCVLSHCQNLHGQSSNPNHKSKSTMMFLLRSTRCDTRSSILRYHKILSIKSAQLVSYSTEYHEKNWNWCWHVPDVIQDFAKIRLQASIVPSQQQVETPQSLPWIGREPQCSTCFGMGLLVFGHDADASGR